MQLAGTFARAHTGYRAIASLSLILTLCPAAAAAEQDAVPGGNQNPPLLFTLQDALKRASAYSPQFQSAVHAAGIARQDMVQAKASMLPSVDYLAQELLTQGNRLTPVGRYVTNDGVHVYRSWGIVRQTVSADTLTRAGYRRATAAEEAAQAQQEIALRGLNLAVAQAYYALVVAEREYAIAQQSLNDAGESLRISQELERNNQAAHSDVITFQIEVNQRQQAFQEATLTVENTRLALAVMLFPDFNQNFSAVDDLDMPPLLPTLPQATAMAQQNNPELRSALAELREMQYGVSEAKAALLPSLSFDADYGIEANEFALHGINVEYPKAGKLPNLGFFITGSLNVPVWHWGADRSKVRQAEEQRAEAQVQLSFAQRQTVQKLYSDYNEAHSAYLELTNLQSSANLAAEALRLNRLRYQGGYATVLDVLNAGKTLAETRNSYVAGLARYRVAVATLQTVTGSF